MDDPTRREMWMTIGKELARAKRLALREANRTESKLADTLGAVERYARKHPRQVVAVTLSLGAAIGAAGAFLLARKSRRGR